MSLAFESQCEIKGRETHTSLGTHAPHTEGSSVHMQSFAISFIVKNCF